MLHFALRIATSASLTPCDEWGCMRHKKSMVLTVLTVCFALLPFGFATTRPTSVISDDIQEKIHREWAMVSQKEQGKGWSYRMSLPLPSVWPLKKDTGQTFYVYAADVLRIMDAEVVAEPWAKVVVSGDKQELVVISKALKELGPQGVHPVSKAETAGEACGQMPKEYDKNLASHGYNRDYYCRWICNNRVIADNLRRAHEDFFRGLNCF